MQASGRILSCKVNLLRGVDLHQRLSEIIGVRVADVVLDDDQLGKMDWLVEGVIGAV